MIPSAKIADFHRSWANPQNPRRVHSWVSGRMVSSDAHREWMCWELRETVCRGTFCERSNLASRWRLLLFAPAHLGVPRLKARTVLIICSHSNANLRRRSFLSGAARFAFRFWVLPVTSQCWGVSVNGFAFLHPSRSFRTCASTFGDGFCMSPSSSVLRLALFATQHFASVNRFNRFAFLRQFSQFRDAVSWPVGLFRV
jgi:hypothetical protein